MGRLNSQLLMPKLRCNSAHFNSLISSFTRVIPGFCLRVKITKRNNHIRGAAAGMIGTVSIASDFFSIDAISLKINVFAIDIPQPV